MRYLLIIIMAGLLMGGTSAFAFPFAQEDEPEIDPKAQQILDLEDEFRVLSVKLEDFDEKTGSLLTAGHNNRALRNMLKDILDQVIGAQTRLEYLGGLLKELRGTGPVKLTEFTILAQFKYFEPSETLSAPVSVKDQIEFTALLGFPESAAAGTPPPQSTPLDTTVVWAVKDSAGLVIEGYGSTSPDQGENPAEARKFSLDTTDLELGSYVVSLTHTLNGATPMTMTDDISFTLEIMGEIIITELDVGGIDGGEPDLMGYYTVPEGVENLEASVTLMNTTTGASIHQDKWAVDDFEAGEFAIEIPGSMMEGDNSYAFTTKISADGLTTAEKTKNFTYIAEETDEDVWDKEPDPEDLEEETEEDQKNKDDEENDGKGDGEDWGDIEETDELTTGGDDVVDAYTLREQMKDKSANAAANDEARNAQRFAQLEGVREEERRIKAEKAARVSARINAEMQSALAGFAANQAQERQNSAQRRAQQTAFSNSIADVSRKADQQKKVYNDCMQRQYSIQGGSAANCSGISSKNAEMEQKRKRKQIRSVPIRKTINRPPSGGGYTPRSTRKPKPKTSFGGNNTNADSTYVPKKRVKAKDYYEVCGKRYPHSEWSFEKTQYVTRTKKILPYNSLDLPIEVWGAQNPKRSKEWIVRGIGYFDNCQLAAKFSGKPGAYEHIYYWPNGQMESKVNDGPGENIENKEWDENGKLIYHYISKNKVGKTIVDIKGK